MHRSIAVLLTDMKSIISRRLSSKNAIETERLGQKIGRLLRGGEVIDLVGDVGTGKTTLVRGLASGMGCKDKVTSPTFTICKLYKGRLNLHHYDFYRLTDDKTVSAELAETADDSRSVIVCEWSRQLEQLARREVISIRFSVGSDDSRQFDILIPEKYAYMDL